MIRVFQLFCKLNFQIVSAESLYNNFMAEIDPDKHSCPWCNTKSPDWKYHAEYDRWLISFEGGATVTYRLQITRYKCSSCGHTHAILPESIIHYQSYSFLFIIAVMKDYYTHTLTVANICTKYNISTSTLYAWKDLFHIPVFLGCRSCVANQPEIPVFQEESSHALNKQFECMILEFACYGLL